MNLKKNQPLAPFTTLGIGGPALWFAEAASEEEIGEAVAWARERAMPLFVLGGGSNLLVSDAGFDGLVLHVRLRGMDVEIGGAAGERVYRAAAGEDWDGLVSRAVVDGCAGIECLAGIPGTVGGTPVQNVGAYGQEVSSTIQRVRALDRTTLQWVEFDNAACEFAYRSSLFNTTARQRYIVSEVTYRLRRGGAPLLTYKDLAQRFSQYETSALTLAAVREAVREIRHRKGMLLVEGDPDCRSAGSFFKNPVLAAAQFAQLAEKFDGIPHYPAGAGTMGAGFVKIPAAWLIEQAGFSKGATVDAVGDTVGISSRHTLALVNRGGATAANLLALRDAIRARVTARFGIVLEQEPVYLSGE